MMARRIALVALVAVLVATACQRNDESDAQHSNAKATPSVAPAEQNDTGAALDDTSVPSVADADQSDTGTALDDTSVAVKEDFVEKAQEEITEDNVEAMVDSLEKEITSE